MPKKAPTEQDRLEFRKRMNEMVAARMEMFAANAGRNAEALGFPPSRYGGRMRN